MASTASHGHCSKEGLSCERVGAEVITVKLKYPLNIRITSQLIGIHNPDTINNQIYIWIYVNPEIRI
jgi:hypothetical protein